MIVSDTLIRSTNGLFGGKRDANSNIIVDFLSRLYVSTISGCKAFISSSYRSKTSSLSGSTRTFTFTKTNVTSTWITNHFNAATPFVNVTNGELVRFPISLTGVTIPTADNLTSQTDLLGDAPAGFSFDYNYSRSYPVQTTGVTEYANVTGQWIVENIGDGGYNYVDRTNGYYTDGDGNRVTYPIYNYNIPLDFIAKYAISPVITEMTVDVSSDGLITNVNYTRGSLEILRATFTKPAENSISPWTASIIN